MDDESHRTLTAFDALCERLAAWLCDTERAEPGPAIAALLHVADVLIRINPDLQAPALGMLGVVQRHTEQALAATQQADWAIARARQPPAAPSPELVPP